MKTPRVGGSRFSREEAMAAVGLDVSFHRAEGSRLWHGLPEERPVWDFLGGYGSTLFGHNHPALRDEAAAFLAAGGVVHGQASRRSASEELRRRLAERLARAVDGRYRIVLASTGSEAVEAAARHAELAWAERRRAVRSSLDDEPREALPWLPGAAHVLADEAIDAGPGSVRAVHDRNRRLLDGPPVHLAAEGSYHGATARARALSGPAGVRPVADGGGAPVVFLDPSDPEAAEKAIRAAGVELFRARRRAGGLDVERVPWHRVASLFLEPVQGEGGIRPLPPPVASAWSRACRRAGVPLVADEIQCGMGRTGTFLHCQQLGVRPDYVLLGKSLGGGLAKVSALAVRDALWLRDFTLRHPSTFAEDDFSSRIALRALELLDEEDGAAAAARTGARLLRDLEALAARYPDVIRAVRGRGLMLGVELRAEPFDRSRALDLFREHGWLGYLVAGFLLRGHGVRVAPTLGEAHTIRLEPAYAVPEEAIEALVGGLEALCRVLRSQDVARLLAAPMGLGGARPGPRPPAAPGHARLDRVAPTGRGPPPRHVGFVGHFISPDDVALWDPGFAALPPGSCERFLARVRPLAEPAVVGRGEVRSCAGPATVLTFVGLPVCSRGFLDALRNGERRALRALVQRGVDRAVEEGCTVVGLGGYCSILTRNGRALEGRGAALTTGNGYTVAAALEAARAATEEAGIRLAGAEAAVVGATGNIGAVVARLLAREVGSLVLVGRPRGAARLQALARQIRDEARDAGQGCPVRAATDPGLCRDASLVVAASNEAGPVLGPRHLGTGSVVVVDVSVPSDIHPSVPAERPRTRILRGGVVRLPGNPDWSLPGVPLAPGEMFACMAETALMGLECAREHGSLGALTPARVRETLDMARRHGFASIRPATASSY